MNVFLALTGSEWYATCTMRRFARALAICLVGPLGAIAAPTVQTGGAAQDTSDDFDYNGPRLYEINAIIIPPADGTMVYFR